MSRQSNSNATKSNATNANAKSFIPSCKVCIDAGQEKTDHFVRNKDGSTNCPFLLSQKCRQCLKNGHTVKYCKQINVEVKAVIIKESSAKPSEAKQVQTNRFSILADEFKKEKKGNTSTIINIAGKNYAVQAVAVPVPVQAKAVQAKAEVQEYPELPKQKAVTKSQIKSEISYLTKLQGTQQEEYQQEDQQEKTAAQQEQEYGDYIYNFMIDKLPSFKPSAAKVTGMLMECTLIEIQEFVQNTTKLYSRIYEALDILYGVQPNKQEAKQEAKQESKQESKQERLAQFLEKKEKNEKKEKFIIKDETDNSAW